MTDNPVKIINHTITRLLARREHSQQELLTKLLQRDLPADLCDVQLRQFVEAGLQSDMRFVESYIRTYSAKGHGENRIKMALREHGIDDNQISNALIDANIDFFELARQVYLKKYGENPVLDWQDKQKRMRFLQYRGFGHEQIQFALENPQSL